MKRRYLSILLLCFSQLLSAASARQQHDIPAVADPAEIALGERLILETRFSQAYYANTNKADPALDYSVTVNQKLRGPFAGKTMNCRACHLVDEHADNRAAGMRLYADFAPRPPVPARKDGAKTSVRNSMAFVNIAIDRENPTLFHHDGEFTSIEDLVRGTFTGRNLGWLPSETETAIKHLANIIREDDGKGELAEESGGQKSGFSYRKLLKGTAQDIPEELRLPEAYRLDVDTASDNEILNAVARLIAAYVTDLEFKKDEAGRYNGSPYDTFLAKNNLPRKPDANETAIEYSERLIAAVDTLSSPQFVTTEDGKFATHQQEFKFAEKELAGMKLFFKQGTAKQPGGNCAACHVAPDFSDFGFHNTGVSQLEYDALHGAGAFNQLDIPALDKRMSNHKAYLPATGQHPMATSRFRQVASKDKPGVTDLGVWNVFANPDMPAPQQRLQTILCNQAKAAGKNNCEVNALLSAAIAAFKTPVLRDLGHSGPYMHNGSSHTLHDAVRRYVTVSALAKAGALRNVAPAFRDMNINAGDVDALVAFLQSLNEDYE